MNAKRKKRQQVWCSVIFAVTSVVVAYVCGLVLFCKPLVNIFTLMDASELTVWLVVWNGLKMLCAPGVAAGLLLVGGIVASIVRYMLDRNNNDEECVA